MTRKSPREIERDLEDLENDHAAELPQPWLADVPQALWADRAAAWRYALENTTP